MAMEVIKVAGLRLKLEGEAEFQQSLRNSNNAVLTAQKQMKLFEEKNKLTGSSIDNLKQKNMFLTNAYDAQTKKVAELQAIYDKTREQYGSQSREAQKLHQELLNGKIKQEQYANAVRENALELAKQESSLIRVGDAAINAGNKLETSGKKLSDVGGKLSMTVTAPLMAAAAYSGKAAMDFESAFAGVKKTVDGSEEDFAKLSSGIRQMSKELPASALQIAAVAESAGQLGIQKENILDFSRVIIDMGESTNLVGEEAASSMAKFANIVQMSQGDFSRLGSSIVALGNNGASTEKDIMAMSMRLAGAGHQVGLTEPQIVGLAASMADVGIEAEAGGSAMSKLLVNMNVAAKNGAQANQVISSTGYSLRELQMMASHSGKDFGELAKSMGYTKDEMKGFIDASATLEGFSEVTGMTSAQFKQAFETDAVGALEAFMKGLGNSKEKGLDAITVLDNMGISEIRLRDTILRTVGAGDKMSASVALSNKAWEENNALQEEAAKRYETTESKIAKAKNRMTDAAITIGGTLLPIAADLLDGIAKLADKFGELDPATQKTIIGFLGVVAAAGPVLKVTGGIMQGVGSVTKAWGTLVKAMGEKSALKAAVESLDEAGVGAGSLASKLSTTTSVAGPAILVIGGLAAAAMSLKIAWEFTYAATNKANEAASDFVSEISNYPAAIAGAKSAFDGFNSATGESAVKIQTLESQISETQGKILTIAQAAATESRAYTDAEREEIERLVGLLAEYTNKKIEAYMQQQTAYRAFVNREKEISTDRADELIKGAQEAADQVIGISETQYKTEILNAEERYGLLGEKDKKAYEDAVSTAELKYKKEVETANKTYAETVQIVGNKLNAQGKYESAYVDKLKKLTNEKVTESERYKSQYKSEADTLKMTSGQILANAVIHQNEENRIAKELAATYKGAAKADLDKWLAIQFQTILYGGNISSENQRMVNSIMNAFGTLEPNVRDDMRNTLVATINEMSKGKPGVQTKARELIASIETGLSGMETAGRHSGSYLVDGLVRGINNNAWRAESAAYNLAKKTSGSSATGFQQRSPSKVYEKMGLNNVLGLANSYRRYEYIATDAARTLSQAIIDASTIDTTDISVPSVGDLRSISTLGLIPSTTTELQHDSVPQSQMMIDYVRLAQAVAAEMRNVTVEVDGREFGRLRRDGVL